MSRQLDLLYTQYYLDDLLFSRTVEVPTVYHCHGLDGRGIGEQVRKRLSTSEICLANTEFIAGELSHSFGIDHDGIVSPGIDLDTFTPDAEPAFRTDEAAVLFVGRLASTNGVHDLVEAYARLESEAELYIAGHGARERPLRDQVSEYGLEDSVHFLGAVPNEELPGYYVSADVVCNPTHYESLGLVNLEALACGRPLVTSRIDAITSYVTHGESGILVPPGDVDALAASLDRLLESPELRQRLSSGARDVARAYSWDRQATHLVEIFSSELSDEDSSV